MNSVNDLSGQPMFCNIEAVLMLIGISRRQFQYLRTLKLFPLPDVHTGKSPMWLRETVERCTKDARAPSRNSRN